MTCDHFVIGAVDTHAEGSNECLAGFWVGTPLDELWFASPRFHCDSFHSATENASG